ncbi:sensor histidine kinase [Ferrimonas sp. SCSIO 43195]|uniref:sensor histidine kinase n=1 Tax=Ferrimonas sp. SCSIO 43195 TaxID=2822844 RepID=UPI0020750B21|nr:sensor histidine kinase [Ferrimonas sp. SCSIO 43195]
MKPLLPLLFALTLVSLCRIECALARQSGEAEEQHLQVGVLANWGYRQAEERWKPMMDYLSARVDGAHFTVRPGSFEELNTALGAGEIQFIVTNPGQYLFLSNQFPLSWLATMRSRKHNGTTYAIGSTIIVRADSDYRTLYDLKGKVIAASGRHALGGYQATVGLMHKLGMNPDDFFDEVKFLGFPLGPLIFQVRDKNIDAAITPFCTLEEMVEKGVIRMEDFRVINPSRPPGYDCQVSTQLYPNWSFAASEEVSSSVTKQITGALYALTPDDPAAIQAGTLGWTAPISQLKVIQLFSDLHYQEQETSKWDLFLSWLEANRKWGILAGLLFLIATFYHLWIEYKFRQKSDTLVETERQLKRKAVQLERLHSAAVVGEIGAGLAHEINQPIAAITNYSEGGIVRLKRQTQPDTEMLALLDKINQQSERAGAVVHRIRGLLKRRETVLMNVNLLSLVDESLSLLKLELERHHIDVRTQVKGEPYFVQADKVGMQQVLINLIKNSIDALSEMETDHHGQIEVRLEFSDDEAWLLVIDNGPGFAQDPDSMIASFSTTKSDGLGLGLAICSDLVKEQHGQFQIRNNEQHQGGCTAKITLPRRPAEPKP